MAITVGCGGIVIVVQRDIVLVIKNGTTLRYDGSGNIAMLIHGEDRRQTQTSWRNHINRSMRATEKYDDEGIPWNDDDATPKDRSSRKYSGAQATIVIKDETGKCKDVPPR